MSLIPIFLLVGIAVITSTASSLILGIQNYDKLNSGVFGQMGPTGPTGTSPSGLGFTGDTGPTGLGFTGQTGPTGLGFTGFTGDTGQTGPGFTGQTGPTGLGFTGFTGDTGQTGPGFTGQTGPTGLGFTGLTGNTGQTGPGFTGPTGQGFTGLTGPAGPAGSGFIPNSSFALSAGGTAFLPSSFSASNLIFSTSPYNNIAGGNTLNTTNGSFTIATAGVYEFSLFLYSSTPGGNVGDWFSFEYGVSNNFGTPRISSFLSTRSVLGADFILNLSLCSGPLYLEWGWIIQPLYRSNGNLTNCEYTFLGSLMRS